MREDQVGSHVVLELFEHVFDLTAHVRKKSVTERVNDDRGTRRCREKRVCTGPGLALALTGGSEHDPRDVDLGSGARERQQGGAAPDLGVVGVGSEYEDAPYGRRV